MLVPKVLLEHKVLRVIKDRMELVDQQVHKVHKVLKVLKVLKDIRGRVELVDPQVLKEQ